MGRSLAQATMRRRHAPCLMLRAGCRPGDSLRDAAAVLLSGMDGATVLCRDVETSRRRYVGTAGLRDCDSVFTYAATSRRTAAPGSWRHGVPGIGGHDHLEISRCADFSRVDSKPPISRTSEVEYRRSVNGDSAAGGVATPYFEDPAATGLTERRSEVGDVGHGSMDPSRREPWGAPTAAGSTERRSSNRTPGIHRDAPPAQGYGASRLRRVCLEHWLRVILRAVDGPKLVPLPHAHLKQRRYLPSRRMFHVKRSGGTRVSAELRRSLGKHLPQSAVPFSTRRFT